MFTEVATTAMSAVLPPAVGRRRGPPTLPSVEDWARLDGCDKLNDTLLDFFLGHLTTRFGKRRLHTFSALFFPRLAVGGWRSVRTWTRGLRREEGSAAGLFERDFLFVPLHDEWVQHWWLGVVCRPWAVGSCRICPSHTTNSEESKTVVAFFDSLSLEDPAATTARQEHALCVLRGYLASEWTACVGKGTYDAASIAGVSIPVPQQDNGTDCGVYVLEFALQLMQGHDPLLGKLGKTPVCLPAGTVDLRCRWRAVGAELCAAMAADSGAWWDLPPTQALAAAPGLAEALATTGFMDDDGSDDEDNRRAWLSTPPDIDTKDNLAEAAGAPMPGPMTIATGAIDIDTVVAHPGTACREGSGAILWLSGKANQHLTERGLWERLHRLGVRPSSDSAGCGADATHVIIAGRLRRTVRVLCAICRGLGVVHLRWVYACIRAGRLLPPASGHEPRLASAADGAEAGSGLSQALARARTRPLLDGRSVYIFDSVPERTALAQIVVAAGGRLQEDLKAVVAHRRLQSPGR